MATKEQRKVAYLKLSEEARDFATSQEVIDIVFSLCKKYLVSAEKQDFIDTLVYETLIGIYSKNDFETKIKTTVGAPIETATSLSKEIHEQIFNPFSDIEKTHGTPAPDLTEVKPKDTSGIKLFLEDQKGNSDNAIPEIPRSVNISKDRTPQPISINNTPGTSLSFQKTIASQTSDSVAPTTENVVVKKQYPGQDPYREAPKP